MMTDEQALVKNLGFSNGRVFVLRGTRTTARQVMITSGHRLFIEGRAVKERFAADALLIPSVANWQVLIEGQPPTQSATNYPMIVGADFRVYALLMHVTWLGIAPKQQKSLADESWSPRLSRVVLFFGGKEFAEQVYVQRSQDQNGNSITLAPLPASS